MTKAAELAKMGEVLTNSQIGGRRNIVINGAISVNQRGDSTGVVADGYYGPDRWHYKTEGEETVSISQASDGPDGFSNSYKVEVTTEDSTIGADDYARIETRLEGQNLQHLKYGASGAESITLSFYVKSSVTGTYAVGVYSADGSRNIGSTYTISSANTWEYKTLTFAGDTGGTLNDDNGEALRIWFLLSSGSNFASSDNTSWAGYSDSRVAYGHTANVIGTANATFFITGVQLEVGEQATPFEHLSYGETLQLCQRYYNVIADGSIQNSMPFGMGCAYLSGTMYSSMRLPTPMRANPSTESTDIANTMIFYRNGAADTMDEVALSISNPHSIEFFNQTDISSTAGHAGFLRINSDTAKFAVTAEL